MPKPKKQKKIIEAWIRVEVVNDFQQDCIERLLKAMFPAVVYQINSQHKQNKAEWVGELIIK